MTAQPLYRLVYRSDAFMLADEARRLELEDILTQSRANNLACGLTGVLTQSADAFVQVLEGPMSTIEETFERICCDARHSGIVVLELIPAERRLFKGWAMAELTPEDQTQALIALIAAPERAVEGSVEQTDAAVQMMATLVDLSSRTAPPLAA